MAVDTRPYFQAANYYYENDKDLNQALVWVNKAAEQNPKAFWILMLKSRIEYKLKDTTSAAASADKVIALATEAKNEDYVKMGQKMLTDIKGKK
jgi:lipopolysaccharide biosynthesis regulator YciM